MVKIGQKAPCFRAPAFLNGDFSELNLSSYEGGWLVLLFYPGDFTFVCATEVSAAAENYEAFKSLGVEVITLSVDSPHVHKAWSEQELNKITEKPIRFPMATDPCGKIGQLYGVFDETENLDQRACFIIDPEGVVQASLITQMSVGRSFEELFRLLSALIYVRKNKDKALPCDWLPGDKVLTPSAKMVGNIHGVWTTANMSIGKFQKSEGGDIWTSNHLRIDAKQK